MWGRMKEWLRSGAIAGANSELGGDLKAELTGVEYGYNVRDEIQLESKDSMKGRGLASPDLADALALTFAHPAAAVADSAPSTAGRETNEAMIRSYWRVARDPDEDRPRGPDMMPDDYEAYKDED